MSNRNEILMKFISRQQQMREGGERANDREMVEGIADILTQVKDPVNRRAIAQNMIGDFKRENVKYNLQDFLQMAKVKMAEGGEAEDLDEVDATETGCPPGYAKINGKCKKVQPFVTSDPKVYAQRKAAYDDSLHTYQMAPGLRKREDNIERHSKNQKENMLKLFKLYDEYEKKGFNFDLGYNRRISEKRKVADGYIGHAVYDYKKPVQEVIYKPAPAKLKAKPPVVVEKTEQEEMMQTLRPTSVTSTPQQLRQLPPRTTEYTSEMIDEDVTDTTSYESAAGDPNYVGGHWEGNTERYIDWDGNSIAFNGIRFRKPGHGGDLIKKGRRHYLHYPSIETRYQAEIVPDEVPEEEFAEGGQHGGLDRWFAEKWVDVKTGKECGRQEGEKRKGYPACRPSKRVSEDTPKTASELSASEKEKFKRTKTSSERIPYQHRRKDAGGEMQDDMYNMKDGGNVPTNPELWSRAKAAAKAKYDVYPSAYANGFAAKWYKERGGGWKKAEMGGCMECGGQMEDGGVYTYSGRPGSLYKKDASRNWMISNKGTGNQFVPLDDPKGLRAKELNAHAVPQTESRDFVSTAVQFVPGVETLIDVSDVIQGAITGNKEQLNRGTIGMTAPFAGRAVMSGLDYATEKTLGKQTADDNAAKRTGIVNMTDAERQKLYLKYGSGGYDKWKADGFPKLEEGGAIDPMMQQDAAQNPGQQQQQMEAALNQVATMIMQGEDPESVAKEMMSEGVPQEVAVQLVQEAMQRLQEDDDYEEEDAPMSADEIDEIITPMQGSEPDANDYERGGSIKIDPSKRGTFKAQATRMGMSVQEAATYILKNKEEFSPAMVKKANFAKNFAKELGGELAQMREGGIPPRYKKMGFTKVGVKKKSTSPGKKWMVLAKKGDRYKIVHGGYKGMKDFTQHRNENRRERFWSRMGGKDSAKARDPFSPLYWHKRFGTWAEGGEYDNGGQYVDGDYVVTQTNQNMLSNLEDNQWNMGLARANSLGDPRMMAWALPNKGLLGKVKAAAGIASGLSGAVLGYEKLFAKDKTESNLYNEKTGEQGRTADILDKRDQAARRQAMMNQTLAPTRMGATSGSGLAGMEAEWKDKDVFGPDYLQAGFAYGGEYGVYEPGGEVIPFREWFAKNAMRPDVMRISYDQAALMEMWKRETGANTAAAPAAPITTAPANNAGPTVANQPAAPVTPAQDPLLQSNPLFKFTDRGDTAGIVAANSAIAGLGMASDVLGQTQRERDYQRLLQRIGNSDERYLSYNPTNPFGNYTVNAGPASNFGLVANTPVQDLGTKMAGARYGGQFSEGGEYYVSDEELKMILAMGGEIEYLD